MKQEAFEDQVAMVTHATVHFDFSKRLPALKGSQHHEAYDFVAASLNIVNEELESKAMSVNLLDTILQLIGNVQLIITNNEGSIRYVSTHLKNYLGNDTLTGTHIEKLFKDYKKLHHKLKTKGRLENEKVELLNSSQTIVPTTMDAHISYYNEEIEGVIFLLKEFFYHSEEKHLEITKLVHDLISPLDSSSNLMELLKEYHQLTMKGLTTLSESQKQFRDKAKRALNRLHTPGYINKEEVHFNDLMHTILNSLSYMEGFSKIKFKVFIWNKKAFYSYTDIISSIIQNLISNAIKYRNLNHHQSKVKIQVRDVPTGIEILVEDNGIGIQKKYLEYIFRKGYRVSQKLTEGEGMGLYITKSYVEKLKGSIHVSSTFGESTSFKIILPKL